MTEHEVRLAVIKHMAEMLLQMTDPELVGGPAGVQQYLDDYSEMSSHLLDSMRFSVVSEDGGVYSITLNPMSPDEYVDSVLADGAE